MEMLTRRVVGAASSASEIVAVVVRTVSLSNAPVEQAL